MKSKRYIYAKQPYICAAIVDNNIKDASKDSYKLSSIKWGKFLN